MLMSDNTTQRIDSPKTFINYISAIVSLIIMLYLLGVWGLLAIYTNQLLHYSKENIPFYVELKDDANEAMVFAFQKKLEASDFIKEQTVKYVSKDQALEILEGDAVITKEDALLLGDNLLPNMIHFCLKDEYFANYEAIVEDVKKNNFVEHVFYTEMPAQNLSTKGYRLEIVLLVLMLFFIFVVVTLIKNTLKLILLANKPLIQTMQLVGATFEQMAQPYLRQSLKNGFLSALIAITCLWLTRVLLENGLGIMAQYDLDFWTGILSGVLIFVGLFCSWICTKHSVRKYLTKPVEQWEL